MTRVPVGKASFFFDKDIQKQYYAAAMLERLVINSLQFAESGECVCLELALAELPRVRGLLWNTDGTLEFSLRGIAVARGKLGLELRLQASLRLACQRCLGEIKFRLEHQRKFCLSDEVPENIADEDDDVDFIPASPKMDVLDLVEEEMLLCLPLAPVHPEQNCTTTANLQLTQQDLSPFASLSRLQR